MGKNKKESSGKEEEEPVVKKSKLEEKIEEGATNTDKIPEVDPTRIRLVGHDIQKRVIKPQKDQPIIYWMSRDQRVRDNWALLYAQELSMRYDTPLIVLFNLNPSFLNASYRHFEFLIKGLEEIEKTLQEEFKIPFWLTRGDPIEEIPKFIKEHKVCGVVSDFSPLKIGKQWKMDLFKNTDVPIYEVDAHNIVPPWVASPKQEYTARTIRSKIHNHLSHYLKEYPKLCINKKEWKGFSDKKPIDWESIYDFYKKNVPLLGPTIDWISPGETKAAAAVTEFLTNNLSKYVDKRNDPTIQGQSNLSPFIHYGMVSSQRIVLDAQKYKSTHKASFDAFVEELVVRKELAENFCHYNENYDNFDGFPQWAKDSLNKHADDPREYNYTYEQWETGKTHDPLWNACQLQMVNTGKMHGFMRMYWGKKILEWSPKPQDAMKLAVELNDKYELDGRDPNGYVGCAWSIGGVHDQGWAERPIFGKVRYMNYAGCKRKFNIDAYMKKFLKIRK